jgi:hypothetical protein
VEQLPDPVGQTLGRARRDQVPGVADVRHHRRAEGRPSSSRTAVTDGRRLLS